MRPMIAAGERTWVLRFAVALVIVSSLPYLIAALNQNDGWVFTGFLFGVEDGNSYIAKMLSGAQGDWLFRSPYSIEFQRGTLLYFPYTLLGKFLGQDAQHGQLVFLFHLFRVSSIFLVSIATYDLLSVFLNQIVLRRLGLILATLGGGLGWLLLLFGAIDWFGSLPLDFYSPEAFGFLAIFGLPHLVLARGLLFWALSIYLRGEPGHRWRLSLLWLAMALTHAVTAALGLVLVGAHLVVLGIFRLEKQKRLAQQTRLVMLAILGAGPILVINVFQFFNDSYLQAWAAQNEILSPHPFHFIAAYGLVIPFAMAGIHSTISRDKSSGLFLLVWLLLLPILLYAPVGLQRRLGEGAWVLLIVLALAAFQRGFWADHQRAKWVLVLTFPTSLVLLIASVQVASRPSLPNFRLASEAAAFEELRSVAQRGESILAAYETSNAVPAWAPLRVVTGHGPESAYLRLPTPQVAAFYSAEMSDNARVQMLYIYNINYVFWGAHERALGDWLPGKAGYLELLFESNGYFVFRVIDE